MTSGRSPWFEYVREDFVSTIFPPGSEVLDVGCGDGNQLRAVQMSGCTVVGLDPDVTAVSRLVADGLDIRCGVAEQLPFPDRRFDGLVCRLVLPYTDERKAIEEWSRVLRPGSSVSASYHGAGYYLHYLLRGPGLRFRVYALRTLINTWLYSVARRRLPGWVGDTLYQSRRRLSRYYEEFGFSLEQAYASPTYLGRPVFIYHILRRAS